MSAGSLRRRLEKPEGGDSRCFECGGLWQVGDPVKYIVVWERDPEPKSLPPCPRSGREREIVVDWADASTPEEITRMEERMLAHAREYPEVHYLRPPVPDYTPDCSSEAEGEG